MRRIRPSVAVTITLLIVGSYAPATAADLFDYRIIPVDTPGSSSIALSLNDSRQVVGSHVETDTGMLRGFVSATGASSELVGFLPTAIGDEGHIVGRVKATPNGYPAVWSGGAVELLPLPDGSSGPFSSATAVNASGDMVGVWYDHATFSKASYAMSWRNGSVEILKSLGGSASIARDINDHAAVVGDSTNERGERHAVIWHGDTATNITASLPTFNATGNSINSRGDVVGSWTDAQGVIRAYFWRGGVASSLSGIAPDLASYAVDINDAGQIIGAAEIAPGVYHAAIWHDGMIQDLNQLIPENSGWELIDATSINRGGDIVGWGLLNGTQQAFLLLPAGTAAIPEPGNLGLTVLGAAALLRRRNSNRSR